MEYRNLGRTGLKVSELCLGTMTFGDDWGWGAAPEESRRIFDAYVDAGGNFIDTADIYTDGTSEKLVGEFVAGDRERCLEAGCEDYDTKPVEFKRLLGKIQEKGLTLIPLKLYFNDAGKVKVELGLAKGRRAYDKRREIADRDAKREMRRALKDEERKG
mgnify:CR=1 FL=1